jgi:hypothetical protein
MVWVWMMDKPLGSWRTWLGRGGAHLAEPGVGHQAAVVQPQHQGPPIASDTGHFGLAFHSHTVPEVHIDFAQFLVAGPAEAEDGVLPSVDRIKVQVVSGSLRTLQAVLRRYQDRVSSGSAKRMCRTLIRLCKGRVHRTTTAKLFLAELQKALMFWPSASTSDAIRLQDPSLTLCCPEAHS